MDVDADQDHARVLRRAVPRIALAAEPRLPVGRIQLANLPAIPADGGAFAYAAKIGLPHEYVALAWGWFKAEMIRREARQGNWRGHFLSALKGNWPKYWYADDAGGWALTTAGKQAQRAQS